MPSSKNKVISAQVLLFGEGGRRFTDAELVAANAAALQAPADAVSAATGYFRNAGFEVGPVVGLGFSITGKASLFEKVFAVKLTADDRGAMQIAGKQGGRALAVSKLPEQVRRCVAAIEFPEPPDFGPAQFY
jgi:hypothetical protein